MNDLGASIAGAGRALGLVIAALGPVAPGAPPAGRVAELVVRLRDVDPRAAQQAARELAELGPAAAPEILGLYCGRVADAGLLAPAERALLLAPLRAWPPDAAVRALLAAVPREASLDERLAALELLGEVGGRTVLAAVEALVAGVAEEERGHARLAQEVERTLARALERDGAAFDELERRLQRGALGAELEERAAVALGRTRRGRGLAALEHLLGRRAALDRTVLEALGELRPFDDPRALSRAGHTLRGYLSAVDPELRRQAALALGRLRDAEAVPELIDLVDDADRRVQRAAGLALGRISGLDASPRSETWEHWYEGELAWLESEADVLRLDLAAAEPARAVSALRLLSLHPLHWSAVAEELQALLAHDQVPVAVAAAAALVKLDDVTAFGPLLEALEDGREPVQAAALAALRALTGAARGPDPEAWRAWLEPGPSR